MFKANTDSYNPVVSHDGKFAMTLPAFYTEIFSSPGPTTIENFHKDPRALPLMLNHSHPDPIVPPASHPAQIVPPASHPTPIVPPSSQPVSSLFHVPATQPTSSIFTFPAIGTSSAVLPSCAYPIAATSTTSAAAHIGTLSLQDLQIPNVSGLVYQPELLVKRSSTTLNLSTEQEMLNHDLSIERMF